MRVFIISLETISPERRIEVLYSCNDGACALAKLAACSDTWEEAIVAGKCRVLMTTYMDGNPIS